MTPEQFIAEAKRRGKSKEETFAKYEQLKANGAFDGGYQADMARKPIPEQSIQGYGNRAGNLADNVASYAGETITNLPGSTAQLFKDTWGAITSPVETAGNMELAFRGLMQKVHPDAMTKEAVPAADAVGQFYKNRYGSVNNILDTFKTDPAGVLSDVSMVGIAPKLSKFTKLDPVDYLVTKATDNITLSPEKLYQKAAKFSTTLNPADLDRKLKTVTREQLMPTSAGNQKLSNILTHLKGNLTQILDAATESGAKIPIQAVISVTDTARKQFEGFKHNSGVNIEKFDAVVENFKAEHGNKQFVTPTEMQDFKKSVQDSIAWDAKRTKDSPLPVEEAEKALARGAKESLETVDPKVAPLNKRMSDLMDVKDDLSRSATRIENRNLLGLSPILGGIIGTAVDPMTGLLSAAMTRLMDAPTVNAKMALLASKYSDNPSMKALKAMPYTETVKILREMQQIKEADKKGLLMP